MELEVKNAEIYANVIARLEEYAEEMVNNLTTLDNIVD